MAQNAAVAAPAGASTDSAERHFPPEELARIAMQLLDPGADPSGCLDALMAALNLVIFLLVDRTASRAVATEAKGSQPCLGTSLSTETVRKLRSDHLEPLDLCIRRCMDGVWAEITAAEERGTGCRHPGGSRGLQVTFTQLQVALQVLGRATELCRTAA